MAMSIRFLLLALAVSAAPLSASTIGQIDNFQDGTTMGWFVPLTTNPNQPANVSTGGPAGVGDAYLQLTATGSAGPGSRLSVLNSSQWAGNYFASGVTLIRMDVNNFGPLDVSLRLLFEDIEGSGPPVNLALSANAVVVPAGSGWVTAEFPITAADLVPFDFGTAAGALADTDIMRIFHNPDPTFPGPNAGIPLVNVTLGVDNITAIGAINNVIPEPSTMFLLAGGLLALFASSRKVKSSRLRK